MKVLTGYQRAKLYIESQPDFTDKSGNFLKELNAGPFITISRQTGIGAVQICNELVKFFADNCEPDSKPWAYFDRELIDKVIEDHNLPERFRKFITNVESKSLDTIYGEMLGTQPPKHFLLRKTAKTIIRLAEFGHSIIVGRGANIITSRMHKSFHVRLIAPLSKRVKNAQVLYGFEKKEAEKFILKEDKARAKYVKTFFHRDIDDPLLYHLVINTALLSFTEIAELIGNIVIKKYFYNNS